MPRIEPWSALALASDISHFGALDSGSKLFPYLHCSLFGSSALSLKHVGTIQIGKVCVNTSKLTSQLALLTLQNGSRREAGYLPNPPSIPHTQPTGAEGLVQGEFLVLLTHPLKVREDEFIFSCPAFKEKWKQKFGSP